jgi:hypothetical protein
LAADRDVLDMPMTPLFSFWRWQDETSVTAQRTNWRRTIMPAGRKRLPGEPNWTPQAVKSPDRVSGGHGNDYGIARGIFALIDRLKRRKAR